MENQQGGEMMRPFYSNVPYVQVKAHDNIILSMSEDFSIFPEICHTARMTTTKIMKLLSMIILNQKQHFTLQKKVTSKERRVQTWAEPMKIVKLILRLALPVKNRDENQNPIIHRVEI